MAAILHHAGRLYTGTAADRAGLTTTGFPQGVMFYETDTNHVYIWDGTEWDQVDFDPYIGPATIETASPGAYTPNVSGDDLVVVNNASGGISVIVPDADAAYYMLGSPSDEFGASISWEFNNDLMRVGSRNAGGDLSLEAGNGVRVVFIQSDNTTQLGTPGTNYSLFGADGDLTFVGTAGLLFGSCYGNHIGWQQANAVQNTWYNIADADITSGPLHGIAHDGNGKLTVTEPGIYLITWSLCFEDDVANDHIEVGIEINGSGAAEAAGQGHLENKFANEEEHLGSGTHLDLADNATIEIAIRTTDAGTPTISVQALNITATMVGGT